MNALGLNDVQSNVSAVLLILLVLRRAQAEGPLKVIMVQDGKLFCDGCQQPIPLGVEPSAQVLVEFNKGSYDRHFCRKCMAQVQNHLPPRDPDERGAK